MAYLSGLRERSGGGRPQGRQLDAALRCGWPTRASAGVRTARPPAIFLRSCRAARVTLPSLNSVGSFPVQWFIEEIQNNPELARSIVRKFIDENQDGELSAEELLRPVY